MAAGDALGTAVALTLTSSGNAAQAAGFLTSSNDFGVFRLDGLAANDSVTVAVDAQKVGSGLNSYLRIFYDPDGGVPANAVEAFVNDDFDGRDSRITFQAQGTGVYYAAVSGFGNADYDAATAAQGGDTSLSGLFNIRVSRQVGNNPLPDLVGVHFDIVQTSAAGNDWLTITYAVQNRGTAATGAGFEVDLRISPDSIFNPLDFDPDNFDPAVQYDFLWTTRSVAALAAGQTFEETFQIQLPDFYTSDIIPPDDESPLPIFLPGELFCGLIIDADRAVTTENNTQNNNNQVRGSDWDGFQWLSKGQEVEANDAPPAAGPAGPDLPPSNYLIPLNSRTDGSIAASGDVDYFAFSVEEKVSGQLTVQVQAAGFDSRLSLLDDAGNLLVRSDGTAPGNPDDSIVFHVVGRGVLEDDGGGLRHYYLKVEGLQEGSGAYQLTTAFDRTRPAFGPLAVNPDSPGDTINPTQFASADLNNDGILDVVGTEFGDGALGSRVYVFLGQGDGSFRDSVAIPGPFPDLASLAFDANSSMPTAFVLGDVTGDGNVDIVVAGEGEFTVFVGDGTGLYDNQPGSVRRIDVPLDDMFSNTIRSVVASDFTHDGILDLIVSANPMDGANHGPALFLVAGTASGSFIQSQIATSDRGRSGPVVTGDFDGDGIVDVAVLSEDPPQEFLEEVRLDTTVNVILLNADGTPKSEVVVPIASSRIIALVAGDFNNDGRADLAATDAGANEVLVFLAATGTFLAAQRYAVEDGPSDIQVADVNNDGRPDLVAASTSNRDPFGFASSTVVASTVSVLLGTGDGAFQSHIGFTQQVVTGERSFGDGLLAADLNSDGRVDLVGSGGRGTVYLGRGDGTFQTAPSFSTGSFPSAAVPGDFNNDGRQDVATANALSGDISVLLAQGDGTFQAEIRTPLSHRPNSIVTADFNRDGRLDLATASDASNRVSVVYGQGDGTFGQERTFVAGNNPGALLLFDFDADGFLDLIVADIGNEVFDDNIPPNSQLALGHQVTVLRGNADGTFQALAPTLVVADYVLALVKGDFDGDGVIDLATLNEAVPPADPDHQASITVFFRNANGTIRNQTTFNLDFSFIGVEFEMPGSGAPFPIHLSALADDFNGDGWADIFSLRLNGQDVIGLVGAGDGTFAVTVVNSLGSTNEAYFSSLALADLDGDTDLDVAMSQVPKVGYLQNLVHMVLYDGQGGTTGAGQFIVGQQPAALVVADFNQDGRPDLVSVNASGSDATVLLGLGVDQASNGLGFETADAISNPIRSTPLVADLDGDGTDDAVVLDRSGNILFRRGQAAQPGSFDSPVVLNQGFPARDITVLTTSAGPRLVAIDAVGDTVSVYVHQTGTTFQRSQPVSTGGTLPTRVVAGNLRGDADGVADDIAVVNGLSRTVGILHSTGGVLTLAGTVNLGIFTPPPPPDDPGSDPPVLPRSLESGFLDLTLVRRDDGVLDLAVTNGPAGDVAILVNDGAGAFTSAGRFRGGLALGGVTPLVPPDANNPAGGSLGFQPLSRDRSGPVAGGDFNGDGLGDVVVANPGSNSVELLISKGPGSYFNPVRLVSGVSVQLVALGQFSNDNSDSIIDNSDKLDIAVIDQSTGTFTILLGNGDGTFSEAIGQTPAGEAVPLEAGSSASGLAVADVNADGRPDLLVANPFGDLLILLGNGDGTFRAPIFQPGQSVPFSVRDFDNDGIKDVLTASELASLAQVQLRTPGSDTFTTPNGVFVGTTRFPTGVALQDMDGDGIDDAILPSSGNNRVEIYKGLGVGQFQFLAQFDVGTTPSNVLAADLNNDTFMDLAVTNKGSNDVSILFGQGGTNWTMTNGPRLAAGIGPTSVSLQQATVGDLIPDLVVTNSVGGVRGDMTVLPGIGTGTTGTGFFQDNNFIPMNVGGDVITPVIDGLIGTTSGIFSGNFFTGAFTQVFASTLLTAFTTATINGNTAIFGGFADGSIRVIDDADLDGEFAESLIFRDAQLTDPSALQVVDNNGTTEIYATSSGQSRVFVFGLSEGVSVSNNDFGVFRDAVVQVQTASDGSQAGIALVAVLVIGERGEDAADGGDSVFIVGLGPDGSPDAATLALLTALLTGTGGEEEGDVGGSEDNGPPILDERVTLEGFIAGVEEAVKRFQQQLAPMPEGGDAPLPEWSRTLDQVFSRWALTAHTAADLLQEPAQRSAAWLIDDGGLGRGTRPPAGGSDDDAGLRRAFAGVEWSLRNAGSSVQQVWQDTYRSLGNSLPAWPRVETPAEMGRHDQGRPLLERDSDWQWSLASALVVAGLWPVRQAVRKQDRRRFGPGVSA